MRKIAPKIASPPFQLAFHRQFRTFVRPARFSARERIASLSLPPKEPAMSTLDAVLSRIDQDIDQSVERLFALLRIASVSTDPAYKEQCRDRRRARGRRPAHRSALTPTCARPRAIRWWWARPTALPARACCFTAITTCSRSIRSNLWKTPPFEPRIETLPDGRKIIVARGACDDKGQAMTFIEACRAYQGGHRQAAAADHHHDRGRGGVRLAAPVQIRARQCRRVQARPGAGLRYRHVGRARRRRSPPRCAGWSMRTSRSPVPTAICIPACSAARRRTRSGCWPRSSAPCGTTTAASPFPASTTA